MNCHFHLLFAHMGHLLHRHSNVHQEMFCAKFGIAQWGDGQRRRRGARGGAATVQRAKFSNIKHQGVWFVTFGSFAAPATTFTRRRQASTPAALSLRPLRRPAAPAGRRPRGSGGSNSHPSDLPTTLWHPGARTRAKSVVKCPGVV